MRAHLSERTLTRRFREETGTSPLQWLLQQRIDRARELLETTTLPMDQVAEHSGLGNADSLRQHFSRRLGISPGAYRAAFGTIELEAHKRERALELCVGVTELDCLSRIPPQIAVYEQRAERDGVHSLEAFASLIASVPFLICRY